MLGMSSELFNKVVVIITTAIFILGIGGFLVYSSIQQQIEEDRLAAVRDASEALEFEKSELTRELNNLERKLLSSLPTGSTLTLVVLSPGERLYTDLFPLFNATNTEYCDSTRDMPLAGVLCLSPGQMPGDEGYITRRQFNEIMEAGWSTGLYIDSANATKLREYLDTMSTLLYESAIDMPTSAYFTKKSYSTGYDALLKEYGITSIYHHEEEGLPVIGQNLATDIWRCGAIDWNTKNIAPAMLASLTTTSGNAAFAFDFKESDPYTCFLADPLAYGAVDRMFDKIRNAVLDGSINVGDLDFGRTKYDEFVKNYTEELPMLEAKKAELRARIAEIDRQLIAIYENNGVVRDEE